MTHPAENGNAILTEGYIAGKTGSDFLACPYELGSRDAIQWMLGHWVWQMEADVLQQSIFMNRASNE